MSQTFAAPNARPSFSISAWLDDLAMKLATRSAKSPVAPKSTGVEQDERAFVNDMIAKHPHTIQCHSDLAGLMTLYPGRF
ncbi:MAG: hypothetical protein AB8B88_08615 [Devosiaceae bacterium]